MASESNGYRLLPEEYRLLSLKTNVDFVNGIFGVHGLKEAVVNLRITDEATAADGSAADCFLADLKSRPNIFVVAF